MHLVDSSTDLLSEYKCVVNKDSMASLQVQLRL